MNTVDENRLTMVTTTTGVILKYKEVWQDHVAFARGFAALEAEQETIDEQAQTAAGKSGAASAKRLALEALGKAGEEIIGAVLAYANEQALPELAAKVNYAPTDFIAGNARKIVTRANTVHAAATEVLANLADYRITAAKLTAFKKKIDAYDSVKTSPREKIVQRSAANQLLPQLIRTAVSILRDQLDGLMVQFKSDRPNFCEECFSARSIVDIRGAQITDNKNSPLNTRTHTPVPQPA